MNTSAIAGIAVSGLTYSGVIFNYISAMAKFDIPRVLGPIYKDRAVHYTNVTCGYKDKAGMFSDKKNIYSDKANIYNPKT